MGPRTLNIISLGIWVAVISVLAASLSGDSKLSINMWSRAFLLHLTHTQEAHLSSPPSAHRMAHIWLAQAVLSSSHPQQALYLLTPELRAQNPFAEHIAGQCFWQIGEPEAAIRAWVQAGDYVSLINTAQDIEIDNPELALSAYQGAQNVDPLQGTRPLVTFLQKQNDQSETAEAVLRQAIQAYPTAREFAIWQRMLAENLEKRGQWQEAQWIYQEILLANPDDYFAWINYGWMQYEALGQVENALASFKKALWIAPKNGLAYFTIARLLAAEERYVEADQWFQQALDRSPDNTSWWHSWAETAIAAGNFQHALKINQMGLENISEDVELTLQVARIYQSMGDLQEAISAAQQAVNFGNLNTWQWLQAGRIFQSAGEIPKAIEAFQQALKLMPENVQAQYHLNLLQTDE